MFNYLTIFILALLLTIKAVLAAPQTLPSHPQSNHSKVLSTVQANSNYRTKKPIKPGRIWNLRNADIRSVIAEVSRETGKNFIIDPRVQGKISIISSTALTPKEVYQVFLSMLQISGYAAINTGKITKIIPNIDAKTQADKHFGLPPKGDEMTVEVIPIKYVPSEQLVPVLRPLMPQWSNVSAYGPSNRLILSGRASNIRRLAQIIRQIDSSSANGIDIIPLRNALAMDIVSTLQDLMKTQMNAPGSRRAKAAVAADDRSNSILISGTKTDRIRLRLLIERLDKKGPAGVGNTKVIYLHYMRAQDLVPILAGIAQANFSGTVGVTLGTISQPKLDSTSPLSDSAMGSSSSDPSTGTSTYTGAGQSSVNPAATPNTQATNAQTEGNNKPQVQLIAEPNTNSVIINAPPSLIRTLQSVIKQLDIKPAQLLIEAIVAEINEKDINDLGIEWGSKQQTGDPLKFRQGFAIINSKTSINDFQAQIYALAQQNKANILSTPSVVVLDNRQAKILVGKQVSVQSTTQVSNLNGAPYSTFDRVNVALHLYVRPQITRGSGIQLQIDQGNDSIDQSDAAALVNVNSATPTFQVSSIVTSVHVESGDIIVLGGLIQDALADKDFKIPIVGDLPGIGRLFQHNTKTREKRVTMVFIRPIILKTERDGLSVTGSKYNDLRKYQLDWLRSQTYNKKNQDILLKPLEQVTIPKPFSHPGPPPLMNTK